MPESHPRAPASQRPLVVVVGLGPGHPGDLTVRAQRSIEAIAVRFLRTRRHPSASSVPDAHAFDDLYETLPSFEAVYAAIVDRLVDAAHRHGTVLYAVPGSPTVAERTVELLRRDERVMVEVQPALSFVDLVWERLGVDPIAEGVRIVDGLAFGSAAAGQGGPFLVAECHSRAVLSEIKLDLDLDGPGPEVVVLQRLGLPDESVRTVRWADLDRVVVPDHLTSLYIPRLATPVAGAFVALEEVMRQLRAGCPWDAEQTHSSLARYAVEEAYELVEAIAALDAVPEASEVGRDRPDDPVDHLQDELGDVLLQVVFHSCLAAEQGWFTLADVAAMQREKLIRRHPHVFRPDDARFPAASSSEDVVANWEAMKRAERGDGGSTPDPMAGLDGSRPALAYATAVLKRAERAGVDRRKHAMEGDGADWPAQMLALVDQARRAGIDPESALRSAAARLRDAVREGVLRSRLTPG